MSHDSKSYLASHGKTLIEHGFNIIPIPRGQKAPGFDGWQKIKATRGTVKAWLEDGFADGGVGILTKETPAVDLDIRDAEVAELMQEWCFENIGKAPTRVGLAPKRLLVYRCDEPFRKMKTGKFVDEWGDEQEIEILGDGQQFVAYGIHKDTHIPYEWITDEEPYITPSEELPLITVEHVTALFKYFFQVAEERGWKRKTNAITGLTKVDAAEDPFADVESIVDIAPDVLRDKLMIVPGNEDYDTWIEIGMALYHQFGGDDEGMALWNEWSESASNYEPEVLEKHWKSFAIEGKRRAPITARSILKKAKDATEVALVQLCLDLKNGISSAKDEKEWREACKAVKNSDIDRLSRETMAELAKQRYIDITGVKIGIAAVRKQLAYELPANPKTPSWCREWVFDAEDDKLFHLKMKVSMTVQGFNAVFSRQALTKQELIEGRTVPETSPFDLAMNVYRIPEVYGRMYLPTQGTLFSVNHIKMANTYPEYQIPSVPEELSPRDHWAIKTVKKHIEHLLADPSEQRLFLNWLAWIVQNPGKLLKWALLLQGVEGDGKTFWGLLLSAVMGPSNVRMLNASVLEGSFTGWAHGQCVIVVEEPRLQGHNKYDVINRIKPLITNPIVEVHAKGKDPYNVENTSNYFLPTNFRDALPLNANDRRYCVLFSRWQQREAIRNFTEAHPSYYVDLYKTIAECAPALRKWLLEHEIDDDFPSGGDAPITKAHKYMVDASTPEAIATINEIIEEGKHYDIGPDLINASALPDAMIGRDTELPSTKGLHNLLEHNGYIFLGRVKLAPSTFGRFWSKKPEMFRDGDQTSNKKIRDYLNERKAEVPWDDEL